MKVLVLKPFPYAADGIKNEIQPEGSEPEIRDELIAGLEQEGFVVVGLPGSSNQKLTPSSDDVVIIPDDWATLKSAALKALAGKIAGREIRDAEEARTAIAAEIEARASRATDLT